jgi:GT2 family glycosyltransferase
MTGEDTVEVSCVVLNWHDAPRTIACIENLASQGLGLAIHVVDNESDGSLGLLLAGVDAPIAEVIPLSENRGFAAGVNAGLRSALRQHPGTPILVINNDATLAPGALAAMVSDLHELGRLGVVGPTYCDAWGEVISVETCFNAVRMRVDRGPTRSLDFLTWACVLLTSQTLDEAGLLDERFFMYWEDVEFGLRLARYDVPLRVCIEAQAVHEGSASHAAAGPKVLTYSTHGLVVLAAILGPRAWLATLFRVLARLARELILGRRAGAAAVARGAWRARDRSRPAWRVFSDITQRMPTPGG